MDDFTSNIEVRKVKDRFGVFEIGESDDAPLCVFKDERNAQLACSHFAVNPEFLIQAKLANRLINSVYEAADGIVEAVLRR